MSEKITRYLLSEIKTVRVVCLKCEAAIEVPIEKLGRHFSASNCTVCKRDFVVPDHPEFNPFQALQEAAKAFAAMKTQAYVQFIFPSE